MKQFILALILLGGCAALQTPKAPKPVEISTPVEVVTTQPEVSKPVEVVTLPQVVVPSVEVQVPVGNPTRFVLESPTSYTKYIPRVEKFFKLALTDSTVINKSKFDFSDATPETIRESIRKGFDITLKTYRPSIWKGGKWSSVIGYHSNGTVFLNEYYIVRDDCEIINTLVHEPFHYMGYSHGDNSPTGKDQSVPYWMGDRAEQLCKEGKI